MAATQTAEPCIQCGTTGGALNGNQHKPWRARQLCRACYMGGYNAGAYLNDSYTVRAYNNPEHMLWHTPMGDRQPHALPFAADYDRVAVIAEAEDFAARWLASHPAYLAKWSPQEAAAA
jgi:hypothetical protein